MKKNKLIWMLGLAVALTACDVNNELDPIPAPDGPNEAFVPGSADFSNYIAVGASFSAGVTDGSLFILGQQNSFPNILATKFKMSNGGDFNLPLMKDNIGGLAQGSVPISNSETRFYFNGSGPVRLAKTPTTQIGVPADNASTFHNYGLPGAKSYHFITPGYGDPAGLATTPPTANPYYVRMAPTQPTALAQVASLQPSFFTISEIGGNDVLGYAISGGTGVDRTGNPDPSTYGGNDITDPGLFTQTFTGMVDALTANGAKGVLANIPYITTLSYFTTVPHDALDPRTNESLAGQIPLLNTVYGALNAVFTNPAINQPNRVVVFDAENTNPVVIKDESLVDLSAQITGAFNANPDFPAFVQQLGLPPQAAPLVAQLMGLTFGQSRPATAEDLMVLPSSGVIGTVNMANVQFLMSQGLSQDLAAQFSAEGVTLPMSDQWVLTVDEVNAVKTATDSYNQTIESLATSKGLAFVDFKTILQNAATVGLPFDQYNLTTTFVTGGLVSLDGVHLTSRGYALMANEMLKAIDATYGSNFETATNGLAKADDYPTNYAPHVE